MKRLIVLLAVAFLLIAGMSAQTFVPTNGPYGYPILSIATNDSGWIFVGDHKELWRHDTSWHKTQLWGTCSTCISYPIASLFKPIAAQNGLVVYSDLNSGSPSQLWQSVDYGKTWGLQPMTGPPAGILSLKFEDNGTLLGGSQRQQTDSITFRGGGVWASADSGSTWNLLGTDSTREGLDSTTVMALALKNPNTIFAGTENYVFRSTDLGMHWTHCSSGFTSPNIFSLAVAPNGTIFAGTGEKGAFRSTDNGDTWVSIGPTDGRAVVFVDVSGALYTGISAHLDGGFYRSTDNGDTWSLITNGFSTFSNREIFQLGSNGSGTLFAGSLQNGIFRSTDGGNAWKQFGVPVQATVVISSDSLPPPLLAKRRLFTGSTYADSIPHIMFSVAGGASYRSLNGLDWNRFDIAGFSGNVSCVMVAPGGIFVGTSSGGVFRSMDGGFTWEHMNFPTTSQTIISLASNSAGDIFAGTEYGNGLYRSPDNGATWVQLRVVQAFIISIAPSPLNDSLIFFGTDREGVYRSTDKGITWNIVGLTTYFINSLSIDAQGIIYAGTNGGVFRSTDDGTTWEPTGSAAFKGYGSYSTLTDVLAVESDGGNVFAGTNQDGLFRSTDDGTTWIPTNAGLASGNVPAVTMRSDGIVYVGTDNVIFRSTAPVKFNFTYAPAHEGWNLISLPFSVTDPNAHTLFPNAISKAYTFDGSYIERPTLDAGVGYWIKFNTNSASMEGNPVARDTIDVKKGWNMIGGISFTAPVNRIGSIPNGLVLSSVFGYATDSGVYKVTNSIEPGRGYWVKVSDSGKLILQKLPSSAMSGKPVFIPTDELPPSPPESPSAATSQIPKEFALYGNYPNPFNPVTQIAFDLPKDVRVKLSVYNVLGQEVVRVIDEEYKAGSYTVPFTSEKLASGIYFYRLEAGSFAQAKKMLLIR